MKKIVRLISLCVATIIFFSCASTKSAEQKFTKLDTVRIWADGYMSLQRDKSKMTAYLPLRQNATGAAAIIFPGGSYIYMDINNEGHNVAKFLAERGIAGFVVDYRTAINGSHHPAMIQDAQRAIQLVKENAAYYGLAAEKVGVIGFSAGGHLAGTAAEYFDTDFLAEMGIEVGVNLKPAFAAMIYPVVTMTEPYVHKRSRKNLLGDNWEDGSLRQMMSLEKNVRTDMPPIFLVQCTGDKTVNFHNATMMDAALTAKNVPHEFLLFDEEGHGFGISAKKYPSNKAWNWCYRFVEWLDEMLNGSD